jgi:hypothetical protein
MFMTLIEQIENDLINSLKSHEDVKTSVLRMLKSAIKNREINIGKKLDDSEIQEVISKEIKQRNDSISQYTLANRNDLVLSEQTELNILKQYQPEQLSSEEINSIIANAINKLNAQSIKDMGNVMAEIMPQIKGKSDSSQVSQIVKEKLNS